MISTRTSYGQFIINGYSDTLDIQIVRNEDDSPLELVRKAIMFANAHKCTISRRVEYTAEKGVTFQVKCDSNTSGFIYEYGRMAMWNASVSDKDLKMYEQKFGTTGCVHKGFKKSFWYCDNFHGHTHTFRTLKEAIESASNEHGNVIYIYTNVEMHNYSRLAHKAKASGICLP